MICLILNFQYFYHSMIKIVVAEIGITISATVYFMFDQKQSNIHGDMHRNSHEFKTPLAELTDRHQ